MSRTQLLRELETYVAFDEREARMATGIADFVRAHPDCFERSLAIGHITASAWVVDADLTHALLTHHRKLDRWLQLGGHADGDADVRRVARREASEESGLTEMRFAMAGIYDVDIHPIPARAGEPEHQHFDVRFAFIADRTQPLIVSAESHDVAWLPIDQLTGPEVDASVARLARKTRRLLARA